jgi:expansin (peptidoglycan-binding protein)
MTFRQVSCPVSGNIGIHIKDGSSVLYSYFTIFFNLRTSWFGLLIYNHRVGISTVEVQPSGSTLWTNLPRQDYNYFLWTCTQQKIVFC